MACCVAQHRVDQSWGEGLWVYCCHDSAYGATLQPSMWLFRKLSLTHVGREVSIQTSNSARRHECRGGLLGWLHRVTFTCSHRGARPATRIPAVLHSLSAVQYRPEQQRTQLLWNVAHHEASCYRWPNKRTRYLQYITPIKRAPRCRIPISYHQKNTVTTDFQRSQHQSPHHYHHCVSKP
jgi:hypothetical protein